MSAPLSGTLMRSHNERLVLACLRDHAPVARTAIADMLGLTKAAITRIVADLMERGYVHEVGLSHGTTGRPSSLLELASDLAGIGFESRVNRTEVVCIETSGKVLHRELLDLPAETSPEEYVATLAATFRRISGQVPHRLTGVGVALPGLLSEDRTTILKTHYFNWSGFELSRHLSEAIGGLPVGLRHNAECAAMANARQPEAAEAKRLLHVQVGSGLGMALTRSKALDETLPVGWGGAGHVLLGDPTRRCVCGKYGCIDTVVGFSQFSRRALSVGLERPATPDGQDQLAAEIVRRADAGEQWALDSLDELRVALARVLALFITIEVPDALTLGGYVLALGDQFLSSLSDSIAYQLAAPSPLIRTTIERDAAGLGAAMLGLNQIISA